MTMSIISNNQSQTNLNNLIAEEVLAVVHVGIAEHEKIAKAKLFIDRLFPLSSGSHQDVSSYVVYYQHLLAFFADGSHSGLRQPKQFVAFNGTKDFPKNEMISYLQKAGVRFGADLNAYTGFDQTV